jgi:hypothetical protein
MPVVGEGDEVVQIAQIHRYRSTLGSVQDDWFSLST